MNSNLILNISSANVRLFSELQRYFQRYFVQKSLWTLKTLLLQEFEALDSVSQCYSNHQKTELAVNAS